MISCAQRNQAAVITFNNLQPRLITNLAFERGEIGGLAEIAVHGENSALVGENLFVVFHGFVAVVFDQLVALGGFDVFSHHFSDQFMKGDFWDPAELFFSLARIAE